MRGTPRFGILLAASLACAPAWALAPASPELTRAQTQIENGDFEEAVKTLQAGLAQPDHTDDQLVDYYRLLGLAQLYLGNQEQARDAYERLLQARPDYQLPPQAPPKLRQLYARIVEDIRRRRLQPVALFLDPIAAVTGTEPVSVSARIENLGLGAQAKLYFRRAGIQTFSSLQFARDKENSVHFVAIIPAYEVPPEPRPYEMEYYAEVADAAQRRLAGKGDAFNPLTFRVAPSAGRTLAEESPWYRKPWIWVVGGVVVAGAVTGAVLIASARQTGTLTVQFNSQAFGP